LGLWWYAQRQLKISNNTDSSSFSATAFGGDKSLKVLQQMMAAAQADRDLLYYTFDESYCGQTLEEWIKQINMLIDQHHPTVGEYP